MTHLYATGCKVLGYKLAQLRMRTTLRDPSRSRIIMFHDIVSDGTRLPDEYASTSRMLADTIDRYKESGFTFVALDRLLELPPAEAEHGLCALTFDDCFSGVASIAAPLLADRGTPYTVYMVSGWLGKDGYLSKEELRALSNEPLCSVGSHSATHPMFRFLSENEALTELTESRRVLEEVTGRPVRHFAFPYGSAYACSRRDIRLAARAGYASAALTTATVLSRSLLRHPYSLPRLDRGILR